MISPVAGPTGCPPNSPDEVEMKAQAEKNLREEILLCAEQGSFVKYASPTPQLLIQIHKDCHSEERHTWGNTAHLCPRESLVTKQEDMQPTAEACWISWA